MSASPPLLSVTVLNYNYAQYLPVCLDSILSQTFQDYELIIINDCSTDDSLVAIQPYLADPRVRLVDHEKNAGYVASLMEGADLSRGKYISVISADDYALDLKAFEIACDVLETDADISFFFSAWQEIDDHGHIRHTRRDYAQSYVIAGADQLRRLCISNPVLHSGTVIRRDAYQSVGGYNQDYRYAVDTIMWLCLCSVGKVAYSERALYAYRAHETNMSNSSAALWQATSEWLQGIELAFTRFSDEALPEKKALTYRAWQNALVAVPTHDIFAGRIQRGWIGYWEGFRRYPVRTGLQRRTPVLILRTLLGAQLYERLRRLGRRERETSRQSVVGKQYKRGA